MLNHIIRHEKENDTRKLVSIPTERIAWNGVFNMARKITTFCGPFLILACTRHKQNTYTSVKHKYSELSLETFQALQSEANG